MPSDPPIIRDVPELQSAIENVTTPRERRHIYQRATFLGLITKLPKERQT